MSRSAIETIDALHWAVDNYAIMNGWTFIGSMGRTRESAVTALLDGLLEPSPLGIHGELAVAEVGVLHAGLSSVLLERFPSLRMLLVDPYHLRAGNEAGEAGDLGYNSQDLDLATKATAPYRARDTHAVQGSVETATWIALDSLDLVFVDGDHSYNGAHTDIVAWWPKVRPGGILAGHDYTLTWPGVMRAVNELAIENKLRVGFTPEVWFLVKPQETDGNSAVSDGSGSIRLPGILWKAHVPGESTCIHWPHIPTVQPLKIEPVAAWKPVFF